MDVYTIITFLVVISSIFGYINVRFLKLPSTIGLMVMAISLTTIIILTGSLIPSVLDFADTLVSEIDFNNLIMNILLSFLLFAGALHTDWSKLKEQRGPIMVLATVGVVASTFLTGTLFYWAVTYVIGYPVAYIHCLLFGALISPTDPIAVLGILKQIGVPKKLEIKFVGESLFNDGIAVVLFLTLFNMAQQGLGHVTTTEVVILFAEEVIGGIVLGLGLGYGTSLLTRSIDHYETEVMITLAVVMGGSFLSSHFHFSAPLAMVVAGLFIGNSTRNSLMSQITIAYLDRFWELVDVFLNAILFVLIGLELLVVSFASEYVIAGLLAIVIVPFARYLVLKAPIRFYRKRLDFVPHTDVIMAWGGLRGGVSIALALSLANDMDREFLLTVTYMVVVFSIIVQGLTVGKLIQRLGVTLDPGKKQVH